MLLLHINTDNKALLYSGQLEIGLFEFENTCLFSLMMNIEEENYAAIMKM